MPRRGGGSEIVTIYWRDIPAQVNGQSGRTRHQVLLSTKFQRAVDRAKRKAGIVTADADIAQWRRESEPCGDDIAAAADAAAAELEAAYSREYLGRLAYVGGFVADLGELGDDEVDRAELLALEELGEHAGDDESEGPNDD